MITDGISTDLDLERRVINYLVQKSRPALKTVSVSAVNGTVVLAGKLNTFYEKQLCQNACQRVTGVIRLVDELDVVDHNARMAVG